VTLPSHVVPGEDPEHVFWAVHVHWPSHVAEAQVGPALQVLLPLPAHVL
jgi:hypothetical protein